MYSLSKNGFTLLELMVVVSIVAVLAAIAVPSYQQYSIRNTENQTKNMMLNVALQAKRLRAKNLNFKNFTPKVGYSDTTKKSFCLPSTTNCKYTVTLVDAAGKSLTDTASNGSGWVMFATPKSGTIYATNKSKKFRLNSAGATCYFKNGESNYASATSSTSCPNSNTWD